jgi:hypothetical protein
LIIKNWYLFKVNFNIISFIVKIVK